MLLEMFGGYNETDSVSRGKSLCVGHVTFKQREGLTPHEYRCLQKKGGSLQTFGQITKMSTASELI